MLEIGGLIKCSDCEWQEGWDASFSSIQKHRKEKHPMHFETKDSGKREKFTSGMVRDTQENKERYDLLDWPMLERWAALMARGAKKYGEENWRKASGDAELRRFKASALRHCVKWFLDQKDEDHGAATFFNIAGAR